MSLKESIKMALSSIFSHKLRSVLTMLGLIIGVGSIITIVALGQMGEEALKSQFVGSGNNTLSVTYNPTPPGEEIDITNLDSQEITPEITETDIIEIRKSPLVKNLILTNSSTVKIPSLDDAFVQAQVSGIEEISFDITNIEIIEGRTLNSHDFNSGNTVTLITNALSEKLFPHGDALGSTININAQPVEIIGIYNDIGNAMEFTDNKIIVPLLLHQNIYQKTSIDSIEIEAFNSNEMEKMGQEVVNILNNDLSDIYTGQYEVFNLKELQESVSGLTRIMTGLIGGIASISLLVAGIGVMNIMLVSVTERTREIGIRKALGATRRLILLQFLIEALIQTVLGGAIGIILAYGGINLLAFVLGWPVIFSPIVILGGLFFSMILGVVFGLLPANKAAKLEPVEALRYE